MFFFTVARFLPLSRVNVARGHWATFTQMGADSISGFVQIMESPEIKTSRFPGKSWKKA